MRALGVLLGDHDSGIAVLFGVGPRPHELLDLLHRASAGIRHILLLEAEVAELRRRIAELQEPPTVDDDG
jgi:hypothetical protein